MRKDVYFCDVCERPKGEANHWFTVNYADVGGGMQRRLDLYLRPWPALTETANTADLHLCGAECVNKVVAKFLVGQKWGK